MNRLDVKMFIHARPKTSRKDIASQFHLSQCKVSRIVYELLESGEIFSMPSVGYFRDYAAYNEWFAQSKPERSERCRKGKVKVEFVTEKTSDVIADCRNSPYMKRVLAFYGRAI
ncbi:hypothetical protein KXR87_13055 [Yokenella regensburgei]|uniref:hypothetical protein n=1 Tax=Yokenella regensburgei TaxID=158877 RepID=UPI003F191257